MTNDFPAAVIFDLDGTLVDSAFDLTGALNFVLRSENRPPVPLAAVRHMVGRGARVLIENGMAATGAAATEDDIARLLPLFLDYYSDHVADESILFPGARAVLLELAEANVRLGICTNKPISLTHQLLRALQIDDLFPAVLGGDSLPFRKPDPRHILETLRLLDIPATKAVMVGDSIHDIEAAKKAPMLVIGVTFGYSETPVADLLPDAVIDAYADLPAALRLLTKDRVF
ncbi:phosphoglycolate phosphatase [Govanella unica]|uniref:Phosphoglycolate phosphatase n=1 Tax=Govanella unica TaxID=2975056 RepID=A0A9X3Z727_9PROT|nr:phosphoglycolate phosphatase [Govania unica]MDA5193623.1 phosphoglycolate phosphatase [Govania unica]